MNQRRLLYKPKETPYKTLLIQKIFNVFKTLILNLLKGQNLKVHIFFVDHDLWESGNFASLFLWQSEERECTTVQMHEVYMVGMSDEVV